jgi:hypothetical protein
MGLGWGALAGALLCVVAGAVAWPPQTVLSTPITNPEISFVLRALGGGVLGILVVAVAVVVWNTIVLPASLLRQTTAPLAKVALGLGLLFNGLVLAAMPRNLIHDIQVTPGRVLKGSLMHESLVTLLTVLGPILCLEIAPKLRSSGILLWAIALQVAALVSGANPSISEMSSSSLHMSWAGLLLVASLPLFGVFLERLARSLERPQLEQLARSSLKELAWCLGAAAPAAVADILGLLPEQAHIQGFPPVIQVVVQAISSIGLCITLILAILLFVDSFKLIRGLQREITQRL